MTLRKALPHLLSEGRQTSNELLSNQTVVQFAYCGLLLLESDELEDESGHHRFKYENEPRSGLNQRVGLDALIHLLRL